MEPIILLFVFCAAFLFGVGGIYLFSRGWESYEEKYVKGAEGTLEAMNLTIPPQHVTEVSDKDRKNRDRGTPSHR